MVGHDNVRVAGIGDFFSRNVESPRRIGPRHSLPEFSKEKARPVQDGVAVK